MIIGPMGLMGPIGLMGHMKTCSKLRHDVRRASALLPERAKAEGVVTFRQAHAGFIRDERAVVEGRDVQLQCTVEEQLAEGGADQILASHDLGDTHRGIIHDAGKLVARRVIFSPDDEITKIAAGDCTLKTAGSIGKGQLLVVGYAKAPVHGDLCLQLRQRVALGGAKFRWVQRLIVEVSLMRGSRRLQHIAA